MGKNRCNIVARVKVNGVEKDSLLHEKLINRIKHRQVANLVYALYKQRGVDVAMDNDPTHHYERNFQGEHNVGDVLEFLKFTDIANDILGATIENIEIAHGVRDKNTGTLKNFDDFEEALKVAQDINNLTKTVNGQQESMHLAATVVRHDSQFQVLVDPVSSNTLMRARNIESRLRLWDALKQKILVSGLDLDALKIDDADILGQEDVIRYIEN
ncbi:MAG: hypothetical protein HUJ71_09315, partial [Pseudobutyrivibrio sp.]|nr:hypothetical protein [Pseudobutyrivibrio sp.]